MTGFPLIHDCDLPKKDVVRVVDTNNGDDNQEKRDDYKSDDDQREKNNEKSDKDYMGRKRELAHLDILEKLFFLDTLGTFLDILGIVSLVTPKKVLLDISEEAKLEVVICYVDKKLY